MVSDTVKCLMLVPLWPAAKAVNMALDYFGFPPAPKEVRQPAVIGYKREKKVRDDGRKYVLLHPVYADQDDGDGAGLTKKDFIDMHEATLVRVLDALLTSVGDRIAPFVVMPLAAVFVTFLVCSQVFLLYLVCFGRSVY